MQSCAIYLSTGAAALASQVAACAAQLPNVCVVDAFTDTAYARSSVKIVGNPDRLLAAVRAASIYALSAIDLSQEPHPAPHPRCGAVDMISFMPLSERKTSTLANDMAVCDKLAWDLGASLGAVGCYVLMYGARAQRTLVETRRRTSFFSSVHRASKEVFSTLPCDFGAANLQQRSGATIVGSQAYVTNFNIQITQGSLEACKHAAARLRSELGVQVMALPHSEGTIEIGCNLQATHDTDSPSTKCILDFIRPLLPGAQVLRSYVVGCTPSEALRRSEISLNLAT